MSGKILIAYATKWGTTEEIAGEIAAAFRASGAACDAKPLHEVESLDGYSAVVLGAPIYYGHLLAGVELFRRRHEAELAKVPRALFVVSLTMARPSKAVVDKLIQQTKRFVEKLKPGDVGLFAGALRYKDLGFFTRMLVKLMGIREGDFRNHDVIRKWAHDALPRLLGR